MGSILSAIWKLFTGTIERPSPSDWLPEPAVIKWAEAIPWQEIVPGLTEKPKIWVPMIPDTNSMDGVFDYGNNNILIAGNNDADHQRILDYITVGDIAVYRTTTAYAIHRIVRMGRDSAGRYYRFKGDNNATKDPGKVRPSNIEWVSIGTIY